MRDAGATLGPANREAVRIYTLLASGVVRDLRLTPFVFDLLNLQLTLPDALRLLERLTLIHEYGSAAPAKAGAVINFEGADGG